jgi:hypothetical protein
MSPLYIVLALVPLAVAFRIGLRPRSLGRPQRSNFETARSPSGSQGKVGGSGR